MNFKYTLFALILLLTACGSSSDDAAYQLMNNIKQSNHLEIQESLSKESYQMMVMFSGNINDKILKPHYRTNQVLDFSLIKLAETDKSARFQVKVKSKSGKYIADTIDLVKQDGDWKISKF